MKKSLLDILACPTCLSPLELAPFLEEQMKSCEVMDGILSCRNCAKAWPVIAGIPRFVPGLVSDHPEFFKKYPEAYSCVQDPDTQKQFRLVHGSTQTRFGYEWMSYPGALPEDRSVFLTETQIEPEVWKGKRVMDAGCGMGRYSRIVHDLGATVVAMDLSGALVRLWDLAKSSDRMHLIQGNLLSPPLREKSFDVVYSIGVIHHTPDAKTAFGRLSGLVKTGGNLTLWVYGTAGPFRDFKTNPLRDDRAGLKKHLFLVWLIVRVRETISNALRLFTVRIPHKLLYGFCYLMAGLGRIPLIKFLTFSVHPLWRVRLQENFDWLSPPYQSHHTKEDLIRWFEENGFEVQKILPHGFVPKPGALGKKK